MSDNMSNALSLYAHDRLVTTPFGLLGTDENALSSPWDTLSVTGGRRARTWRKAICCSLFSPDEEIFANALMWKNLLLRTCTALLWEGQRDGRRVAVWGGRAAVASAP